ncbi:MAG: hypothetical protein AB1512_16445, partial [Thermodesulfobacteriota bacterium]
SLRNLFQTTLILMGDWCSQGIADTEHQRNNGKGNDDGDRYTLRERKTQFSSKGVPFSLDGCLLMGDPVTS